MPIIDALQKYLDTSAPAWEAIDTSRDLRATDLSAAIQAAAHVAVAGIIAQGASARTPAKKQAWQSLPPTTAGRIAALLEHVAAGETSAEAIDQLLHGGSQ